MPLPGHGEGRIVVATTTRVAEGLYHHGSKAEDRTATVDTVDMVDKATTQHHGPNKLLQAHRITTMVPMLAMENRAAMAHHHHRHLQVCLHSYSSTQPTHLHPRLAARLLHRQLRTTHHLPLRPDRLALVEDGLY